MTFGAIANITQIKIEKEGTTFAVEYKQQAACTETSLSSNCRQQCCLCQQSLLLVSLVLSRLFVAVNEISSQLMENVPQRG